MSEQGIDVLRRYLDDAVAAGRGFESQLRSFSREGDDAEARSLFVQSANEIGRQCELLSARLRELGGQPSQTKSLLAHFFAMAPRAAQLTHRAEERIAQNLIMAYAFHKSERAMYQSLAVVAANAGDSSTADLVQQMCNEKNETAQQFFHLIPSRSKIAFNILTAGEIDPAVETKAPENRLTDDSLL